MRQYQQNICYVMDGSVPVARCVCEEDAQAIVERLNNLADALDAERKARREAESLLRALCAEADNEDSLSAPMRDAVANADAYLARAAGEGKAEKPEPRDPRACPTCGSLSTFNGACMKCHEDYAMGGG